MTTSLYRAERNALQRVGYEASTMPLPGCAGCEHMAYRSGDPHHCDIYEHFLQPCPVRRREMERDAAPRRATLEEVAG